MQRAMNFHAVRSNLQTLGWGLTANNNMFTAYRHDLPHSEISSDDLDDLYHKVIKRNIGNRAKPKKGNYNVKA